jgi:putative flavoprotein involved in K+ transport
MPPDRGGPSDAIVIGAGPAGLAAAAMLQREGIPTLVLERAELVAVSWRRHYDRLRLHTVRWLSDLPGLPLPRSEGRWVSRDGVIRYLDRYAAQQRLRVQLRTEVQRVERAHDGEGAGWLLRTSDGALTARSVVVATGFNHHPVLPDWPGRDDFPGGLLHSSVYRNPRPYTGRDVLVVGAGNSGAEIATDLAEGGAARVRLSVRTPPNILPRALLGIPTQVLGIAMRPLPPPVVDRLSTLTRRLVLGDLSRYGTPPPPRGMYTRAIEEERVPILDVGLVPALKSGRVQVVAAVERFDGPQVVLADGGRLRPDVVIAATGFRHGLEPLVGHLGVLGPHGLPVVHGPVTAAQAPGLYFIGFTNPISGILREIGRDARRIARVAARRRTDHALVVSS